MTRPYVGLVRNVIGDKRLPTCHRCEQSGTSCVYPTSRKPITIETKYKSLRRKLEALNQTERLEDFLDHIHPNVLQAALTRQASKTGALAPMGDNIADLRSSAEVFQVWPATDKSPVPVTPYDTTTPQTRVHSEGSCFPENECLYNFVFESLSHIPDGLLHDTIRIDESHTTFAPSFSAELMSESHTFYTIPFPALLVDELVHLYFQRVQPSISLLHKPRFFKKFNIAGEDSERFHHMSLEDALTLTAMMALSARYSKHEFFDSILSKDKGKVFAKKAMALYADILQSSAIDRCSLQFLQGCILLAFYFQFQGDTTRGWLLIGTCCRLGIDLELDLVDRDLGINLLASTKDDVDAAHQWSAKEEQRRAWWLVWELDIFTATILRRPRGITNDQMNILLPVSDLAWFSDTPTKSTFLETDILHAWQTLEHLPDADARAWFLVTTYMMTVAANLTAPRSTLTLQDILNFESTLICFTLSLPEAFHLDLSHTPFDDNNFASGNWAFQTVFMLHSVRVLTRNAQYTKASDSLQSFASGVVTLPTGPYTDTYQVLRAMQNWSPEYLIYACPFVVCTLIGPSFDNVRAALLYEPGSHGNYLSLLKLILKRIGTFWGIGETALKLVEIFEHELKMNGSFRKQAFRGYTKDFSLLVADPTRNTT